MKSRDKHAPARPVQSSRQDTTTRQSPPQDTARRQSPPQDTRRRRSPREDTATTESVDRRAPRAATAPAPRHGGAASASSGRTGARVESGPRPLATASQRRAADSNTSHAAGPHAAGFRAAEP